jgi:hypothetical protein
VDIGLQDTSRKFIAREVFAANDKSNPSYSKETSAPGRHIVRRVEVLKQTPLL